VSGIVGNEIHGMTMIALDKVSLPMVTMSLSNHLISTSIKVKASSCSSAEMI
jgi:hypothetical protein